MSKQTSLFRGIYEFEDDTGSILAAKVPHTGSVDLYDDTAIVVRPNQRAMFIYKGKIADVLKPGIHEVSTENIPIITRLASWKWGGRSPLRAEIWFFTGNKHIGKKFGTSTPVLSQFKEVGTVPIRAFGSYNVRLANPRKVFEELIGSRTHFNIAHLEDFVQAQLIELLPNALNGVDDIQTLSQQQDKVSQKLEELSNKVFKKYGIKVSDIQIKSILPSKEIMEALESKIAMSLVGDPKKYLLYKTANGLDELANNNTGDSTSMLMALMLGKGVTGLEDNEVQTSEKPKKVAHIRGFSQPRNFCPHCGGEL